MDYLYIVYTSVVSVIVLFIITKVIGNKQMSELNMFDYINGITIGSIAAEAATATDKNFYYPLIAMAVYGVLGLAISVLSSKSIKFRRIMTGRSIILVEMGKIYRKNLSKTRLDINELTAQLRNQGYFNIDDIAYAFLEANGKVSVIPKEASRPATVSDVGAVSNQTKPAVTIISDGKVLKSNLKGVSVSYERLKSEAKAAGANDLSDVFLALCRDDGNISIYLKDDEGPKYEFFE